MVLNGSLKIPVPILTALRKTRDQIINTVTVNVYSTCTIVHCNLVVTKPQKFNLHIHLLHVHVHVVNVHVNLLKVQNA